MLQIVTVAAYGLSCLIYLGLAVRAASLRDESGARWAVALGGGASALWAGAIMAATLDAPVPKWGFETAELLRDLAWLHLLLGFLDRLDARRPATARRALASRALIPGGFVLALTQVGPYLLGALPSPYLLLTSLAMKILVSVLGLWLIEIVVTRSGPSGRWGIKHLALALAAIFGFDLYFYSDIVLLRHLDADLVTVRGLVGVLIGPLLWVSLQRMRSWAEAKDRLLNISPRAAMQGVVLIGSGLYLLVMAGLASALKEAGGEWGNPLQAAFLIGVLLLMVVAIGSGRFKSQIRVIFHKYFFTYKYDYREEWRRFIGMMGAHRPLSLGERIVHAFADIMDSPAGALWLWQRQDDALIPDVAWNYHGARPAERGDSPFVRFLRDTGWVIEIGKNSAPAGAPRPDLPAWLSEHATLWLVVPLIYRGEVLGLVALDRARAPRSLDWEDRDLLKTLGAHAASYLAEEVSAEALSETQRLAEFNRRFAFVVHDIKNVVGQMSLIVENAERHIDNPEFQRDMMRTVTNSVERLKALLDQLAQKRRETGVAVSAVDLSAAAASVAERWRAASASFDADLSGEPVVASASAENFVAALDLLIDNALGAIGPSGRVVLRLRGDGARAVVEIQDDGPGMEMDFVYKELFRPLRSTKSSGFGIGAYQTRQLIREMGGQLEVDTAPNRGTIMRILLPLATGAGAAVPSA